MDRIVFITDVDTQLGSSLLKHCYTDYKHIVGTISSPVKEFSFSDVIDERLDIIEWNRRSPFEAKNILLSVIKKYKKLDEVLVIHSSMADTTQLHNIEVADIDMTVDIWIKSYIFLCREILNYFSSKTGGLLLLINNIHYENKKNTSPLFELIKHGFSGFMQQLMRVYKDRSITINGIESSSPDAKELSTFIYKCLCERLRNLSGKIVTFKKKGKLFFL
jgi:NADP-dependent 3-hydroxy acid dehydrogenase YdfG